ncbi:hypothetical protein [Trichothermofontia sp.]
MSRYRLTITIDFNTDDGPPNLERLKAAIKKLGDFLTADKDRKHFWQAQRTEQYTDSDAKDYKIVWNLCFDKRGFLQ